jgi:hypothetical protein
MKKSKIFKVKWEMIKFIYMNFFRHIQMNKKLKFKIDGLLKMIYVKVKDVPICTNISIIEFKSLKN